MQADKPLKLKPQLTSDAAKEAAAALRAQLQSELQNIKQCAYKGYECTQLTLEGYNYCLRHILQDKTAPYKQCTYVYNNNGKRCYLPAPKDKKDSGYCNEHALKAHLANSKRGSRCQPPRTAEVLLHSVSHYIKKPRVRTLSSNTQYSDEDRSTPDDNDGLVTKSLDPFVDIDASSVLASESEVLDMCSESESDVEATSYGSVWHDAHADSSDNDSIDSEQEDVLKHANVYSAEEITLITRDKLIRLQSLYIDQYRYLHHMLRERRRRYLYCLKREKDTCCSIANQIHDSPKEQRMYNKLKAFNSYHRKHGIEAVCSKRLHERRLKVTEGIAPKPHTFSKCIFTEGGVKCGERALPVTRHCRKHILEDPNQILFRACSKMRGDVECTTPVEAIFDDATCRLHMDIPPIRCYSQNRKDSESDYDDSLEANNSASTAVIAKAILPPQRQNIKLESEDNTVPPSMLDAAEAKEEVTSVYGESNLLGSVDTEMPRSHSDHINAETTCDLKNSPMQCDPEINISTPETEGVDSHSDTIAVGDLQMDTDSAVSVDALPTEASHVEMIPQVESEVELESQEAVAAANDISMENDNQGSMEKEKIKPLLCAL